MGPRHADAGDTAGLRILVASALFVVLVGLGLAAADKPPPVGFVVWVALAGATSLAVWWRSARWNRTWMAARDGAVAGVLIGVLLVVSGGEPTVQVPAWMRFATVLGCVAAGALGGWLLGVLLVGRNSGAGGET